MSKIDGVIRVHPNGMNGKALVFVRDAKKFDTDKLKTAFEGSKKLRLSKFRKVSKDATF